MAEASEEVNIKVNNLKKVDCNESEVLESKDTQSSINENNSNTSKNCTSQENGKQSPVDSDGDEVACSPKQNKNSDLKDAMENHGSGPEQNLTQPNKSPIEEEPHETTHSSAEDDNSGSKEVNSHTDELKKTVSQEALSSEDENCDETPAARKDSVNNDEDNSDKSDLEKSSVGSKDAISNNKDDSNQSTLEKSPVGSKDVNDDNVNPSSPVECNSDNEEHDTQNSSESHKAVNSKASDKGDLAISSLVEETSTTITDGRSSSESTNTPMESESMDTSNSCESKESPKKSSSPGNKSLVEAMDVDSTNSIDAGTSTKSKRLRELASREESSSKIKLRSFASLCDDEDMQKPIITNSGTTPEEVSGVSVGDIVQHSNIVEHDKAGVLHLKISDIVGKEECITGLSEDDTLSSLQITSVVSLTEPLSPEEPQESSESRLRIATVGTVPDAAITTLAGKDKKGQTVIIYKNRLVVMTTCIACRKQCICKYRLLYKPAKPYIKFPYLCSDKCKDNFLTILPANQKVEKPNRFFERLCSMCDKVLVTKDIVHWQTREFCNKLCLADHIGEVARHCFECKTAVKVMFMGKYCVRFGSEIHQFCSNHCLESYKIKVDSCAYCQKNLENVNHVVSELPKKYCSIMCLRRSQRGDIGQKNYATLNNCTVCNKAKVNQFEFLNNNESVLLCSNPCLSVYKYVNQAKAVNCCMCSRFVNAEDFPDYFYTNNQLRVFCSESCLSVFIITARRVVPCQYCKVKKYNFDMIQKGNFEVFYCSICCLNLMDSDRGKQVTETLQIDSANVPKTDEQEPILKICQLCNKNLPAQFHMVMSDSTLRSFCSYNCACKFKTSFGFQVSGINTPDKADAQATPEPPLQPIPKPAKKAPAKQQNAASKVDFQALANILKEFEPPEVANKWTSCSPNKTTVAIQSTPDICNKGIQTDEDGRPPFVPVPFPMFLPAPMMMYSANVPIPLILPIPIPVPVFIPTTEKTTDDILKRMNKIQNEIPDDPIQAELLLLAKGQEAEMQQELESQITEEDLQTPQMVLEEPDEVLNFVDNDEDLSLLDKSIHKFTCEDEGKRGKKKRLKSYDDGDDDVPESKRQKTSGEKSDDILNPAYGLSVWVDWVRKKNTELKQKANSHLINEDLVQISPEAINECLSMFLGELEESQDRLYEIDTIFYLLLGIQKVMFERGSSFCIFLEDRFDKFGCTFDQMITRYLKRTFDSDITGFQMLNGSRITEDMLWQCRQLGAHTPYVLLNTLFYFSTKCYKLRTVDDHMALSFSQVIRQWRRACLVEGSYMRTTLLKYFPRQAHFDKTELEMHENRVDPLKCPVKLYEFYLSKCPESVRSQQGLYYVYPETCCMPDSPVWFSTGAMNATTIKRMLHRVLLVREIQEALYH